VLRQTYSNGSVLLGTCNGGSLVLWRLTFVMFFSLSTIMQGRVPAIFLQKKNLIQSVLLLRSRRPQSNKLEVDSVLNCLKL
jgi:hypothetical protein